MVIIFCSLHEDFDKLNIVTSDVWYRLLLRTELNGIIYIFLFDWFKLFKLQKTGIKMLKINNNNKYSSLCQLIHWVWSDKVMYILLHQLKFKLIHHHVFESLSLFKFFGQNSCWRNSRLLLPTFFFCNRHNSFLSFGGPQLYNSEALPFTYNQYIDMT